jgi:hypothetical protein
MNAKRKSSGMTRQQVECLGEVIGWLRTHEGTTPLEIGVLEEVHDRLSTHVHLAGIVRVRLKNRPHQSNPQRAVSGPLPERGVWHRWSDEDRDRLATFFREGKHFDVIADEMGKSQGAIEEQIARLGLWHSRPKPLPRTVNYRKASSPLSRAKQVFAERRHREMLQPGERQEWCDD